MDSSLVKMKYDDKLMYWKVKPANYFRPSFRDVRTTIPVCVLDRGGQLLEATCPSTTGLLALWPRIHAIDKYGQRSIAGSYPDAGQSYPDRD